MTTEGSYDKAMDERRWAMDPVADGRVEVARPRPAGRGHTHDLGGHPGRLRPNRCVEHNGHGVCACWLLIGVRSPDTAPWLARPDHGRQHRHVIIVRLRRNYDDPGTHACTGQGAASPEGASEDRSDCRCCPGSQGRPTRQGCGVHHADDVADSGNHHDHHHHDESRHRRVGLGRQSHESGSTGPDGRACMSPQAAQLVSAAAMSSSPRIRAAAPASSRAA